MGFELVESSVLKVFKMPIHISVGLADHYYLSEIASLDNSVGWGQKGLELWGKVRVTPLEMERIVSNESHEYQSPARSGKVCPIAASNR